MTAPRNLAAASRSTECGPDCKLPFYAVQNLRSERWYAASGQRQTQCSQQRRQAEKLDARWVHCRSSHPLRSSLS